MAFELYLVSSEIVSCSNEESKCFRFQVKKRKESLLKLSPNECSFAEHFDCIENPPCCSYVNSSGEVGVFSYGYGREGFDILSFIWDEYYDDPELNNEQCVGVLSELKLLKSLFLEDEELSIGDLEEKLIAVARLELFFENVVKMNGCVSCCSD